MEFGILTDAKEEQLENAYFPIVVTESGIVIDIKELHLTNAPSPIEIIEFGIFIEDKEEQQINALNPIDVTELGISIDVKDDNLSKNESVLDKSNIIHKALHNSNESLDKSELDSEKTNS